MAESAVSIILQMIFFLIRSTLDTFLGVASLFGKLPASLGPLSQALGPAGFGLSILIIGLVGFFIAKFLFRDAKRLIILVVASFVLAYLLILGAII